MSHWISVLVGCRMTPKWLTLIGYDAEMTHSYRLWRENDSLLSGYDAEILNWLTLIGLWRWKKQLTLIEPYNNLQVQVLWNLSLGAWCCHLEGGSLRLRWDKTEKNKTDETRLVCFFCAAHHRGSSWGRLCWGKTLLWPRPRLVLCQGKKRKKIESKDEGKAKLETQARFFVEFLRPSWFFHLWISDSREVKAEQESSSKKRKTERQAALSKLPGDATLVKDGLLENNNTFGLNEQTAQEILDYLAMFTDPLNDGAGSHQLHPVDTVMQAFKDETTAKDTMTRLRTFLEEACKVHASKLDEAMIPEPWDLSYKFYCLFLYFWIDFSALSSSFLMFFSFLSSCFFLSYQWYWSWGHWWAETQRAPDSSCPCFLDQLEESRWWFAVCVRLGDVLCLLYLQWQPTQPWAFGSELGSCYTKWCYSEVWREEGIHQTDPMIKPYGFGFDVIVLCMYMYCIYINSIFFGPYVDFYVCPGLAHCSYSWLLLTLIRLQPRRGVVKSYIEGVDLALCQELILPLLPSIKVLFDLPCNLTANQTVEDISFEAIQLSTQGSERQRKDAVWLN